jgi:hypothetical protein
MHLLSMRAVDLHQLNRLTRYGEISSYHARDPDSGQLLESPHRAAGEIVATEKIDGAHARLVMMPDGYFLGDRTRFLYAHGDLIANSSQNIVKTVRPLADTWLAAVPTRPAGLVVVYGEVFGGTINSASQQYTSKRELGFRVFDVAQGDDATNLAYFHEDALAAFVQERGWKLAPRVARFPTPDLPKTISKTRTFLEEVLPTSRCRLDGDASGTPEGLVLRKADRSWIVTLTLSDYRLTKRRR